MVEATVKVFVVAKLIVEQVQADEPSSSYVPLDLPHVSLSRLPRNLIYNSAQNFDVGDQKNLLKLMFHKILEKTRKFDMACIYVCRDNANAILHVYLECYLACLDSLFRGFLRNVYSTIGLTDHGI